jgi:hypothetical protein
MRVAGRVIFEIWDASDRTKLFGSAPQDFGQDMGLTRTWKVSEEFSFTLLAGKQYVIGTTCNVDHDDVFDVVPESQNGITSEMVMWALSGFPSRSIRPFFTGADSAIRLYGVPEPSTLALAALGTFGLLIAARRKLTAPAS